MNDIKIKTLNEFGLYKKKGRYLLFVNIDFDFYNHLTINKPSKIKLAIMKYYVVSDFLNKFTTDIYILESSLIQLYETLNNLHVTDELKSYKIKIIDGRKKIQTFNIFLNTKLKIKFISLFRKSLFDETHAGINFYVHNDDCVFFENILFDLETIKRLLKE